MATGRPTPAALASAVVAVLAVLGALWWLWPTLTGAGDDVDVLVVGDGTLAGARRSIELRVREAGLSIEWYEGAGWCGELDALASAVDVTRPAHVVVTFTPGAECLEEAAAALADVGLLAVVDRPADDPAVAAGGFDIVDPTRLTSTPDGPATLPCEWWEEPCPPGGTTVREADGTLTEAGGERLARILVTAL
ncbi:MAG: hypothetical protein ACRDZZ_01890 [Ilumatobacteraceae bacterium]